MSPIFDRNGRAVGWLKDAAVFDINQQCRAFVRGGSVFTYEGHYLGRLENGYFRDSRGCAVAYVEGAAKRLSIPSTEVPPPRPNLPVPPLPPIPPNPPVAPVPLPAWSHLDWNSFLS